MLYAWCICIDLCKIKKKQNRYIGTRWRNRKSITGQHARLTSSPFVDGNRVAFRWINSIESSRRRSSRNLAQDLASRFFSSVERRRQVFNFYNEPPPLPLMKLASRRRGGVSVSQTRRAHARRESAILTNLPLETRPRRAIPKGSAGANGERAATLSEVQHRCQQANWNF